MAYGLRTIAHGHALWSTACGFVGGAALPETPPRDSGGLPSESARVRSAVSTRRSRRAGHGLLRRPQAVEQSRGAPPRRPPAPAFDSALQAVFSGLSAGLSSDGLKRVRKARVRVGVAGLLRQPLAATSKKAKQHDFRAMLLQFKKCEPSSG